MKQTMIRLEQVTKVFEKEPVIHQLNLNVREGEFLTLLGPSGCGKTTTLRMIAGFEDVSQGQIFLDGEDVAALPPDQRNVNTVFQNYALFPHMNVFDNVAFGLVEKKVPKAEIAVRVREMLHLVQLDGMEKRMPNQMSGGQKQRVAIARALVNRPKVLLLDEPLGALDLKLRRQMQFELKLLQKQTKITFIYVTHDQEEALTMSDRVAVMNNGIIEQIGTPKDVYDHPENRFVAGFIGESNIFEAYIEEKNQDSFVAVMESGKVKLYEREFAFDEMIYVCVRPENIHISVEPVKDFTIRGKVREHIFTGAFAKTIVELPSSQRISMIRPAGEDTVEAGTNVYVWWEPHKAVVMHTREEQLYNIIESSCQEHEG